MEILNDLIFPAIVNSFSLEAGYFDKSFWKYVVYEVGLGPVAFDMFSAEIDPGQWLMDGGVMQTDLRLVKESVDVYVPVLVSKVDDDGVWLNLSVKSVEMQVSDPFLFLEWQQKYN